MTYREKRLRLLKLCIRQALNVEYSKVLYMQCDYRLTQIIKADINKMLNMFVVANDISKLNVNVIHTTRELKIEVTYEEANRNQYVTLNFNII